MCSLKFMLSYIASRPDFYQEQSDLGSHSLSRPFLSCNHDQCLNFLTFTVKPV